MVVSQQLTVFDSLLCIICVDFCILCVSSAFVSAGVCLVLVEAVVVFFECYSEYHWYSVEGAIQLSCYWHCIIGISSHICCHIFQGCS